MPEYDNYKTKEKQYDMRCPVCGAKGWDEAYLNRDNEMIGCDLCVRTYDAVLYEAFFAPELDEDPPEREILGADE